MPTEYWVELGYQVENNFYAVSDPSAPHTGFGDIPITFDGFALDKIVEAAPPAQYMLNFNTLFSPYRYVYQEIYAGVPIYSEPGGEGVVVGVEYLIGDVTVLSSYAVSSGPAPATLLGPVEQASLDHVNREPEHEATATYYQFAWFKVLIPDSKPTPPVASDGEVTDRDPGLSAGSTITGQLSVTAPAGDPLQYAIEGAPSSGSVSINPDGSFSYVLGPTFPGEDSFKFLVIDKTTELSSAVATETIATKPTVTDYLLASELAYDDTLPGYSTQTEDYLSALGAAHFSVLASVSDSSGMTAEAFINTTSKEIIIAYRGTVFSPDYPIQTYQDLYTLDTTGIFEVHPAVLLDAFKAAVAFAQKIEQQKSGYTLFVTGHSLGGAEAEAVAAAISGDPAFGGGATFAAPGVSALLPPEPIGSVSSLTDYVITDDPVATFSNGDAPGDGKGGAIGQAVNGPGQHIGVVAPLTPTALGVGKAAGLATGVLLSHLFTAGGLSISLALTKNISLTSAIFGLPQHLLTNYGDALVHAGVISANPLAAPDTDAMAASPVSILASLFENAANPLVAVVGNKIVQSAEVHLATALGTAVVDLAETYTATGAAVFSMIVRSGVHVAEQLLTDTDSGAVTDVITLDGARLVTPDLSAGNPAALDVAADGSILVGVSSPTSGDELTISLSPTDQAAISSGGDGSVALDTFDTLTLKPNGVLEVGAIAGGAAPSVSETPDPTPLADHFLAAGVSDMLLENASGVVVAGEVSAGATDFTALSNLGSEWSFRGAGDFVGDGGADFLIENASGAVVVGDVEQGQAVYATVGALGPEWKFVGAGDFLGDGKSDFLIENASGAVVVGEVAGGHAGYTQVAALGPEWMFVGAGDYFGDGRADLLIENTAGAVVVGEVANGQAGYTLVGALGPEWRFVASGDFLGDGRDQALIENAAGQVDLAEAVSGQLHYTAVIGLGPEWKFVGAGDYLGEGHDQFLIENTAGIVTVGDWANGAIHFANVTALGPEWAFH